MKLTSEVKRAASSSFENGNGGVKGAQRIDVGKCCSSSWWQNAQYYHQGHEFVLRVFWMIEVFVSCWWCQQPSCGGCHCRCLLRLDVSSNFPCMAALGIWKFHAERDLRNHGVQCFCSTRRKYNPERRQLASSKWWLYQWLEQNPGFLSSHQCSFLCSARPSLVNYLAAC